MLHEHPGGALVLDGASLTPEQVYAFVHDDSMRIDLDEHALDRVRASKAFLDEEARGKVIYGVTTGFGPMASHIISKDALVDLQRNLVRSHATGAGDPIDQRFVLAAMVCRLNTMLKGNSGVSEALVRHLQTVINGRIIPIIPEHGAVGTSGDLVQLAHIALTLIGEGEVMHKGVRRPTKDVFAELGIMPAVLEPKEGLALINGTAVMTGISSLLVCEAQQLLSLAIRSGALAIELMRGLSDAYSESLQAVRPHKGQRDVAAKLRAIFSDSRLMTDRRELQARVDVTDATYVTPEHIQEVYSFRCIPQILGPVLDTVRRVHADITTELNSATDNPIIDLEARMFLHGGNFHGEYMAVAADHLKMSMVKTTILSERRSNFFFNRNVNQTFPPFLNMNQPGLTLALQGMQFVATSTTAQSQSLAYPHSLHSISTNGDNQDVVSMGTDAALMTSKVIQNAFIVLAIELIALAQAVDIAKVSEHLSSGSHILYERIRAQVPVLIEDRSSSRELGALIAALKSDPSLAIE